MEEGEAAEQCIGVGAAWTAASAVTLAGLTVECLMPLGRGLPCLWQGWHEALMPAAGDMQGFDLSALRIGVKSQKMAQIRSCERFWPDSYPILSMKSQIRGQRDAEGGVPCAPLHRPGRCRPGSRSQFHDIARHSGNGNGRDNSPSSSWKFR